MSYVCYRNGCENGAVSVCIFKIKYGVSNITEIPVCPEKGCLVNFDPCGKTIFFINIIPKNFDYYYNTSAYVTVLGNIEGLKTADKYPNNVRIINNDISGARISYLYLMRQDPILNILTGLIDIKFKSCRSKINKWKKYVYGLYSYIRGNDNDFATNFYRLYNTMKTKNVTMGMIAKRGEKEIEKENKRFSKFIDSASTIEHGGKIGCLIELSEKNWLIKNEIAEYLFANMDVFFVMVCRNEKDDVMVLARYEENNCVYSCAAVMDGNPNNPQVTEKFAHTTLPEENMNAIMTNAQ